MPKVILANYVHTDGKGDFTHLIDIARELKENPVYKDFEVVVVVDCSIWPKEHFESRLKELGLKYYLGRSDDNLWENPDLQKDLQQAVQIIQISHSGFPLRNYAQYINPNTRIKFIGEHECHDPIMADTVKIPGHPEIPIESFPMGLSKRATGIKVKSGSKVADPYQVILDNDPAFIDLLLRASHAANLTDFRDNNIFVPAYFSKLNNFYPFLALLAANTSLPQDKDMTIYLSSNSSGFLKMDIESIIQRSSSPLSETSIKEIVLVQKTKDADELQISTIPLNAAGNRTVRIITGCYLSDASFNALFDCANVIAGVSGDNTFEMTVSHEIMSFYASTNFNNKKPTLKKICEIIEKMDIPEAIKKDLLIFFDPENIAKLLDYVCRGRPQNFKEIFESFANLNLPEMSKVWHNNIAPYLREHHNLYTNLQQIFMEGLAPEIIESQRPVIGTGNYSYSQVSQHHNLSSHQPNLDDSPVNDPLHKSSLDK